MLRFERLFLVLLGIFLCGACAGNRTSTKDHFLKESHDAITVRMRAPYPPEVSNKTQAMALARDAAVASGQTLLLNHILNKETKSDKTLAEAEFPSIKLQTEIRGVIKGARILKTKYEDNECWVILSISQRQVKKLLKEN